MKPSIKLFSTYPKVGVVILNWDGADDTIDCVSSLRNADYPNLLIIVFENASTDNSFERLHGWLQHSDARWHLASYPEVLSEERFFPETNEGKEILLIRSVENFGFCKGNNIGMELSVRYGAKYILVMNNDTEATPDFLGPMVEIAENTDQIGLLGSIITYCEPAGIIWWAGGKFNRFLDNTRLLDRQPLSALTHTQPFETEWVSGCMMMIPAHIYHKFGGFEERYFIWSEEWEYSLRVARAGYKLLVVPQSRICHKIGQSLGIMKPLNYYYGMRNTLLFKQKYLPKYIWYPYLSYYLLNRTVRFTQFFFQGRKDLAYAGVSALRDYFMGRTGIWREQQRWRHEKI